MRLSPIAAMAALALWSAIPGNAGADPVTPPEHAEEVAKHLSQLASAGLVAPTREGRETRYRITPEPLEDAVAWIVQAGGEWDARLARLSAYVGDDRGA